MLANTSCSTMASPVSSTPRCSGKQIRLQWRSPRPVRRDLGKGDQLCRADLGLVEASFEDRRLLGGVGIGGDIADPQMVVGKISKRPFPGSRGARPRCASAPPTFRRARSNATATSPAAAAFKSLVVDEAVDGFQDRLQVFGEFEIVVLGLSFGGGLQRSRRTSASPLHGAGRCRRDVTALRGERRPRPTADPIPDAGPNGASRAGNR